MRKSPHLTIVVPCYNEEDVLPETAARLLQLLDDLVEAGAVTAESSVYFIDDGSTDATWKLIENSAGGHSRVKGIKLAHNAGHQNALMAGLMSADGDAIVSVDADLQDDLQVIKQMVSQYSQGKDVVLGVRGSRDSDSIFKRATAETYYKLLHLMGVDVVFNHADFRLMSRKAIEALRQFTEVNLFLRGIVVTLGFETGIVTYERSQRFAGESKYPIRRMLALAFDGITSFSAVPLRIIALLGFFVFFVSMAVSVWALWVRLFSDHAVPGWASSVLPMYLLGGVQLLSLGVIGEYIAKIYLETKKRPRYVIEKSVS